jgi:hypothetical protein
MGPKKKRGSSRKARAAEKTEAAEKAEEAKKALDWVIGRLSVLEYLILFFAMAVALLGGALVSWLLRPVLPLSFRASWALVSLLLFMLPGGFVYLRESRKKGKHLEADSKSKLKETHG